MKTLLLEHGITLGGIFVFLVLNAILVASELALIKVRFSHFNPHLVEKLEEHPRLSVWLDRPDRKVQVIRIGIVFCIVGYGALLFSPLLDFTGRVEVSLFGAETPISIVLSILVAVGLHYIVAETVPRAVGINFPIQTLGATALLIRTGSFVLRPFLRPLEATSRGILRGLGIDEMRQLESLDLEAQLEMLESEEPEISVVAMKMLRNTLAMRHLVVADVLLPRNQVQIFDLELSNQENLKLAIETGHTRFPLCQGDLDHCLGLIHIKDLFRHRGDLKKVNFRRLKRDMIRVGSEEPLEEALSKLLSNNVHMALVIDEFRGAEGVLTLERILEQLVGDIRDEFDSDEELLIRSSKEDPEEILVQGVTPLHEIEERFGIQIENDEVSTIGGLITSELGRIPETGETLRILNLDVEVSDVDETRVKEAKVRLLGDDELSGKEEPQSED